MLDVITIGSATIDIFAYTDKSRFLCIPKGKGKKMCYISYPAGEKILLNQIDYTTGGGGSNTAVSFSRLGFRTAYLGHLGIDRDGDRIIDELKHEKVSFIGTRGKEKTNTSIVLDSIGHDRTVLAYKKASESLDFSAISKPRLNAKLFYFSSLMGKSFAAMRELVDLASKKGVKVAFNPSSYQARLGKERLRQILNKTDILILNKEEAQLLTGSASPDTCRLLRLLKACGKSIGISGITDGKNGAHVFDGSVMYSLSARKNLKVVETTGAGDAFASTFISGMMMGMTVDDSLRMGMINSESVITHHGAKNRLLTRKELLSALKRDKRVVKKRHLC